MPIPYGQNSKQDLELISALIFSENPSDDKKTSELATQIRDHVLKTGGLENLFDLSKLDSDNGVRFVKALGKSFDNKGDEKKYKRIIQIASIVGSGKELNQLSKPTGPSKLGSKSSGKTLTPKGAY